MELTSLDDFASVRVCQGKTLHETRKQAETVAARRMLLNGLPLYVYQCSVCYGWHLTKRENFRGVPSIRVDPANQKKKGPPPLEIPAGTKFGRFTVGEKISAKPAKYECRCECGNVEKRRSSAILNPNNRHDCCAACQFVISQEKAKARARLGVDVDSRTLFLIAFRGALLTGRLCKGKPVLRIA